MAFEDLCKNSGLCLTLFSHDHQSKHEYFQLDHRREMKKTSDDQFVNLSLGLCASDQSSLTFDASKLHGQLKPPAGYNNNNNNKVLLQQASSISSFSSSTVKRDCRDASSEEVEIIINKRVCNSKVVSDDQEEGGARKKLRLSKQQALVLEDSFKENTTLNSKQKQALAKHLNLRDRQVEVWFQNRRARTKLKQTEIECELLNKLCKTLRDENRKLEKEVQELKALKRKAPLHYRQLFPAAMLSVCASCSAERTAAALTCQSSTKPLVSIQHTNTVLWPPQ